MTSSAAKKMPRQAAEEASAASWERLEQLVPWQKNPRVNDHAVDDVAASLIKFGAGSPLLARRENGEIIAGHTRRKAALSLAARWQAASPEERASWHPEAVRVAELGEMPVRRLDLSERDAHLLALADNRLSEKADWALPDLQELLAGFDAQEVQIAGWSGEDLEQMTKDIAKAGGDGDAEVAEDEVPEPPKVPVTKLGDVWQLGKSVLVCGDSRQALTRFTGARLLITDPPYGVDYTAKNARLNKFDGGNRLETGIENDALPLEEMVVFWTEVLSAARAVLLPGSSYYIAAPGPCDLLYGFMGALQQAGLPLRHMLVWVKNNHALSAGDYHYKHEPILYGWTEGAGHMRVADRSQMSTWEIDRPQKADLHPTMKPVELYARAMRNSSEHGDFVVEPFAGSGTAYSAAAQLDRHVYGVEISPAYCDVIIERWQTLTGGKAERRSS
jgi:DNA modification methylase